MKLTFELPEWGCEHGFEQCPYLNDGLCWGSGYPPQRVERAGDKLLCRHPTCPFHGPVRVTMEDSNA